MFEVVWGFESFVAVFAVLWSSEVSCFGHAMMGFYFHTIFAILYCGVCSFAGF